MTYAFGRLCGLGSLPWHESEVTGRMVGNPSVSETVATYMTSLRRRKVNSGFNHKLRSGLTHFSPRSAQERQQLFTQVRAGETATSARAITQVLDFSILFEHRPDSHLQETLAKVYEFNNRPEFSTVKEYAAGSRKRDTPSGAERVRVDS